MAKKDFSQANTGRVFDAISDATAEIKRPIVEEAAEEIPEEAPKPKKQYKARKTYDKQETQEALDTLTTQGKKGLKALRINMAFPPAIHQYVAVMSKAKGITMTQFVNLVLSQHMDLIKDIYEEAQDVVKRMRSL